MYNFVVKNKIYIILLLLFIFLLPSFVTLFSIHVSKIQPNSLDILKDTDCSVTYKSINQTSNIEVKFFDIYVFPEVENLLCLGKVKEVELIDGKTLITVYKNPKIFQYLSLLNLFGLVMLFFLNDKYIFIDSLFIFFNAFLIFSFIFYQNNNLSSLLIFLLLIYPYLKVKDYLYPELFKNYKDTIFINILKDKKKLKLTEKYKKLYPIFIFGILFERILFTNLANWQLDQSVSMWVGYKYSIFEIPVGTISSVFLPNPNGMIVIGKLLSFFPNLRSVSIFLTIFQAVILLNIQFSAPKKFRKDFSIVILCLLSSLYLVNSSIEFWNQYMMLNINLIFIALVIRLVKNRNPNIAPLFFLLVFICPSLYIAGLIHGISIFVISIYTIYKLTDLSNIKIKQQLIYIILISLFFFFITWIPYISSISLSDIKNVETSNPNSNLSSFFTALINFPENFLFQWSNFKSHQASILTFAEPNEILSPLTRNLQASLIKFHGLIAIIFITQLIVITISRKNRKLEEKFYKDFLVTIFSYLMFAYLLSPALGSYQIGEMDIKKWGNPSLAVGFYPISILIFFLFPYVYQKTKVFEKIFIPINKYLLVIFLLINISFTHSVYQDNFKYDGLRLHNSDVPWNQKTEAIEFIVNDWREKSNSNIIPVYYDFGKLEWKSWITSFGYRMTRYYEAPFTHGRAFDYELSKKYGLVNSQEGIQRRSMYPNRYIISYFSLEAPDIKNKEEKHYKIGRLRVTIISEEE